ncbi:MAG: uroporphyrinogen decarboxylase family protein [Anaerolineales bacterium]
MSMTGRERLLATLRHESADKVPWVPFAGVHAGRLKGYSATEMLTDVDKLVSSLLAVNQLYMPDGQPVVFDLQLEAEILGCALVWAEEAPPSVATHPLSNEAVVPTRLPEASDGRLPIVLEAMRRLKAAVGEQTALYGLVTGPLTLASHLRGSELFMDMFDRPDYVHALLNFAKAVAQRMTALYLAEGMDVIAIVDPLVSQVSPRTFKQFLQAPYGELFTDIREAGAFSSFFVCGDATKNIEVMCLTGPDSISVDENIDLPKAKLITDRYNIAIGGNIPLTTCMLLGNQLDNIKFVVDLLDQVDHHNLIVAPGCDMPYATPIENTIGAAQAVHDPDTYREIVRNYQRTALDYDVVLPDYAHLSRPLIEVFTLDSASCAACAYMLAAAQEVANELGDRVELVEYKITVPENIARMHKMGITNLPSILVNGELKYSSIIPSHRELLDTIRQYLPAQ